MFIITHKTPGNVTLFFGTHRALGHEFMKNVFAGWKPNAYQYNEPEANQKAIELRQQGWSNITVIPA